MQCPNCQHWNEAGARFCEECGVELPQKSETVVPISVRPVIDQDVDGALPPIPPQVLVPLPDPDVALYVGPHLMLTSTGSIFKLGQSTLIGREDPALQIDFDGYPDSKFVSQRHAQITKINNRYYIEDLESSNFTYVNDRKLLKGQAEPIDEGDVIRLGKIELTFHGS